MRRCLLFLVIMALLYTVGTQVVCRAAQFSDIRLDVSSLQGEHLNYRLYWGFIPAATASLTVTKSGDNCLKFDLYAQTLPVVRWIYPVRDVVTSVVTVPGPVPVHYHKDSKEGWRARKIVDVVFKDGMCFYYRDGRLKKKLKLNGVVQDPLSAFFVFRMMNFKHSPVDIRMTDGKRIVTGKIYVLGKQIITTPAGTFKTIVIQPKLHGLKGVFEKSPHSKVLVWLTDDKWRIPVQMQSKVIVGHFIAKLVSAKLAPGERLCTVAK